MGCYYALVQYVPEAGVDDRLTVGMVAIDDETGYGASVFTSDWDRVRCFGNQHPDFLREFIRELRDEVGDVQRMTLVARSREWLEEYSYHFQNSIQFTPISWAPVNAVEWVNQFGPVYVRGINIAHERADIYDQDRLAIESRHVVGDILDSHFGIPAGRRLVREAQVPVRDLRATRTIDAALQNGRIYFGALTTPLSSREGVAQRQIDTVYQSALDIQSVYSDLPLIVITSPIRSNMEDLSTVDNIDTVFQLQRRCVDANIGVARLDEEELLVRLMERSLTAEVLAQIRSLALS